MVRVICAVKQWPFEHSIVHALNIPAGTQLVLTVRFGRPLAAITQALSVAYIVWRAVRSLPVGWLYFYSLPVLLAEITIWLMSQVFVLSIWSQVDRRTR